MQGIPLAVRHLCLDFQFRKYEDYPIGAALNNMLSLIHIYRIAGGLDHKYVSTPDILVDDYLYFAI